MTHPIHLPTVHASTRLYIAAGVLAGLLLLAGAAQYPITAAVAEHDIRATVAETADDIAIGVSVDTGRIDFGAVPQDAMTVERTVSITNGDAHAKTLQLAVTGNASAYTALGHDTVTVPPETTANVTILWNATDAAPGTYTGTLHVTEDRPLWEVLWS